MKFFFFIYKWWKIRQLLQIAKNLSKFDAVHYIEVQKQIYDIRFEISVLDGTVVSLEEYDALLKKVEKKNEEYALLIEKYNSLTTVIEELEN